MGRSPRGDHRHRTPCDAADERDDDRVIEDADQHPKAGVYLTE